MKKKKYSFHFNFIGRPFRCLPLGAGVNFHPILAINLHFFINNTNNKTTAPKFAQKLNNFNGVNIQK